MPTTRSGSATTPPTPIIARAATHRSPKHFIDIEDYPEFATGTLSHNYDTLVTKHGLTTVTKIGVVPWAIIWSLDSLTDCLQKGDSVRALQFAADLGHYVGDAHQPLHATTNYDGPNNTSDGIHSRYESTMLATYNYLNQVTVFAESVHFVPVPIDTNFAFIMHSNGLADSIFNADTYATAIDAQLAVLITQRYGRDGRHDPKPDTGCYRRPGQSVVYCGN